MVLSLGKVVSKNSMIISDNRFERKFSITNLTHYEIQHIVCNHPYAFTEIYTERNVNNIYFDSSFLTNYYDNVDGLSNRIKVRIRWYGEQSTGAIF